MGLVLRHVLHAHREALRVCGLDELLGPGPGVHVVGALGSDLLQVLGHARTFPALAHRNQVAVRHVGLARLGVLDEVPLLHEPIVDAVHERGHHGPFLGRGDGRLEIARPVHGAAAVTLPDRFEAAHHAADGDLRHIPVIVAFGPRTLGHRVQRPVRLAGGVIADDRHRAEVRDLVEIVHVLHEDGGDHGVHRVPAVLQHLERRLAHDWKLGGHHDRVADRLRLRPLVELWIGSVLRHPGGGEGKDPHDQQGSFEMRVVHCAPPLLCCDQCPAAYPSRLGSLTP